MPWDGRQRGELWSSTIVYSVEAPWRIISREFPQLPICLETDSKEENDDYRPRTIKTHHFIADRPPAPFNELFHKEVVDEITGNNEFVQLLGEVSPPASTSIPSPDSWVGPDLWESEDSEAWTEQGRHPANSCEKSWILLNLLVFVWIYLNSTGFWAAAPVGYEVL